MNNNISRSAVFDAIDKINKSLKGYEDVLKLYDKSVCEEYDNQVLEFKEILKTESDLESALTTYEWKLRDYNNSKTLKRTI